MTKKKLLLKPKSVNPPRPFEPRKPTEYDEIHHDLVDHCSEYDALDFEGLTKKLPKNIDASSLRFERVDVHTDDYGYVSDPYFTIYYLEKKKNPNYKKQLQKYEKDLAKYEADLSTYQAWEKEQEIKDEAWELKQLKKRLKELEKKAAK